MTLIGYQRTRNLLCEVVQCAQPASAERTRLESGRRGEDVDRFRLFQSPINFNLSNTTTGALAPGLSVKTKTPNLQAS